MSWSSRRTLTVLGAVTLLGAISFQLVQAQLDELPVRKRPIGGLKDPVKPPLLAEGELHGITLPTEEDLKRRVREIAVLIQAEDWPAATDRLQQLLDRNDDVFAPVPRVGVDGKVAETMVSVKAEATRLIGNLPKAGMDYYKVTFGPRAMEDLKAARADSDAALLAKIMARYLYTDAGADAAELLATYQLDRGNYSQAAICFERLIQRAGAQKLAPLTLFKAAIAFQHTGDKASQDLVWKQFEGKTEELTLGSKTVAVTDLRAYVAKRRSEALAKERYDCLMVRGDPSRNAQGDGTTAYLSPRWKHDTVTEKTSKDWLKQATDKLDANRQPIMHGFSPIAATLSTEDGKVPLMIYRSFWGIHARAVKTATKIDAETKKPEWQAGEIYWEAPSAWSMDKMLREPRNVGTLNQWLLNYVNNGVRPQILFENSVVGSLSSDNARVYAVEDFQVPPQGTQQAGRFPGQPGVGIGVGGPIGQAMRHNRLQAFDLDSGKLVWEAGTIDGKGDLDECFFLGAPLPLNGKLYCLNEKDQELRLVCLDAATGHLTARPQRLGDLREKIHNEISRRYNAAHLAYGEGILVCPTNSGGILGVDLLTNSLVWAYGYKDKGSPQQPMGQPGGPPGMIMLPTGQWVPAPATSNWMATPPVVSEGKVIFTAPDSSAVHCINLRDGSRVWKNPRKEGDLYLAGVFAGKALVIGKNYARGINVADGSEAWTHETGVPSGIGIASKDVYYLPLAKAVKTQEPELCLIDMAGGFIKAHTRSRKKEVPGNLLFYEGEVLSQALTQVASYPQLEVELKTIDALLAKNPKDPEGLTRRGDLYLDKGALGEAIADLRVALENMNEKHPPELKDTAKLKLYESLTEYFQRDFNKAEQYIKEYEAMTSVVRPGLNQAELKVAQAEEKRRKGNYYCLVGRGKEAQKDLKAAFEAYMNFGALGAVDNEMMSAVDDPGVKTSPRVWAEGRIANMVARANKEELAPLEKLVADRWSKVQNSTDVETLRNFVNTFGSIADIGRVARLQLAERLLLDTADTALVDAERHLSILRTQKADPAMAGRAVEVLARLMTRKGLMEDAAYFYRVLGRDHGKTLVRDGKTGQDFYNDLATDKRFLPYLDEPTVSFSGKVQSNEFNESHTYAGNLFQLEQVGEKLPYFEMNSRLAVRSDYNQLKLINRETGEEIWSMNLNDTNFARLAQFNQRQPSVQPRFTFQTLGHLVLFQVGHKVFAIDATNKKEPRLWEKNLAPSSGMPQIRTNRNTGQTELTIDPRDGSTQVVYLDGWMQRLGHTGTLSPVAVPILTSESLKGIDPISGQVLWDRGDMPKSSHIYSDATHIYTVEVGADGNTGATRVFRLHDGVVEKVKDFSETYRNRIKTFGRTILTKDDDARGVTVRLYDILKSEDVWKSTFPAGSFVLQPTSDDLAGVVEPSGKATIIDLTTMKSLELKGLPVLDPKTNKVEKLRPAILPEHLQRIRVLSLLRDGTSVYIACEAQPEQAVDMNSLQSNLMPGSGLRSLALNGYLYSFDRKTGEINWFNNAENQMIVLDEFERVPVVLMTSRYRKWLDQFRSQQMNVATLRSYDKKTGKLLWDKEDPNTTRYQQFHTIKVDARGGKVDLLSYNLRWSHFLEGKGGGAPGGAGGMGPGGRTTPPTVPVPPGFRGRGGIAPGFVPQGVPVQPPQIIERRIIRD